MMDCETLYVWFRKGEVYGMYKISSTTTEMLLWAEIAIVSFFILKYS
jgi:hypothetical protein